MKKYLKFKDGIIPGIEVRDILKVFPEIENKFTQRKTYDEYYYESTKVDLTLESLEKLISLDFTIEIDWEKVTINYG